MSTTQNPTPTPTPPHDLWGDVRSMLWDWNTDPDACVARVLRLDREAQRYTIFALLGLVQGAEPDMGALMRLINVAEAGMTS